jgi:hypothetical protein
MKLKNIHSGIILLKPRVLLCGSSGADVTAESDSSLTTRPLMETQYNTEQQQQ